MRDAGLLLVTTSFSSCILIDFATVAYVLGSAFPKDRDQDEQDRRHGPSD